ncbi:thioredoxin family protein [Salinicola acroporae]|uniref:Thiol reductase thioredoxin n=1 Tax=Salinicola acroporae TaxID=1541440 RepID=A0ABT6I3C2_9GAMM|nr:thioredoxin family protein [Salinicola acroporae]MDH4571820.1 thiol reductase thioredoxin [Salinicola acroporae]
MMSDYTTDEPDREALRATPGPVVVEFGAPWCPWCQAARPRIDEAFEGSEGLTHFKIEDGKGRPLGRAFRVKLWPTLIFLLDGEEIARCVRPESAESVKQALAKIVTSG